MLENIGTLGVLIGCLLSTSIYICKKKQFNSFALIGVAAGFICSFIFPYYTYVGYYTTNIGLGIFISHTIISAYDLIALPIGNKVKYFGECEFKYGRVVKTSDSQTYHSSTTVREGVFGGLVANTDHYTTQHSSKAIETITGEIHIISETNEITQASEGDYVVYAGGKNDRQFAFYNITKQSIQKNPLPKIKSVIGSTIVLSIPYIGTIVALGGVLLATGIFKLRSNPLLDTGATPRDKGHYIFAASSHVLIVYFVMLMRDPHDIGGTAIKMIALLAIANAVHFTAWMMDTRNFSNYIDREVKKIISEQHIPSFKNN